MKELLQVWSAGPLGLKLHHEGAQGTNADGRIQPTMGVTKRRVIRHAKPSPLRADTIVKDIGNNSVKFCNNKFRECRDDIAFLPYFGHPRRQGKGSQLSARQKGTKFASPPPSPHPQESGSATSPIHYRGSPTKGNKMRNRCHTLAFSGAQMSAPSGTPSLAMSSIN